MKHRVWRQIEVYSKLDWTESPRTDIIHKPTFMLQPVIVSLIFLAASFPPICVSAEETKIEADPILVDEYTDDSFKVFSDPSGKAYFPEGKASCYTPYLLAMKEPSVQADLPDGATFVLRFTLIPSFTDNLVVRIYDKDGKFHARAVRQKKDRNYNPVQITDDRTIALDANLREQFKDLFSNPGFWKPLSDNEEGMQGFDGVSWIFEMKDKSGYHMLDLWSPDNERLSDEMLKEAGFDPAQLRDYSPYVKAGNTLLKLAKFDREEKKSE